MTGSPRLCKAMPLAALLSAVIVQPAPAWEAGDVAERFRALLDRQGVEARWSGVRRNGDSAVLEGFSVGLKSADGTVALGDLELEEIDETDEAYEVGQVRIDHFETAQDGVEMTMNGLLVEGLVLPREGAETPYGGILWYRRFALEDLAIGTGGQTPAFTLAGLRATVAPEEAGGPLEFTGAAERFVLDAASLADGEAGESLRQFGYERISGRLDMAGRWNPVDGRATLSRYEATVEDAGTLGITLDISGYTPDFIKALQDIQARMDQSSQQQQQAQGLAMLGLMQQLNLVGASIRFSDASLTEKILAYLAAKQGIAPGDVANQAKAIVPLMAGQYLGPALTGSLSAAIGTYLDDPQSLEIRIAPAEPAPFAVLMGAAMGSPDALVEQLGLMIVANE